MLLWLFKLFSVRKTLWHKLHTALLSGCKCCCSLCLFNVSLVLNSLPQTSHRWQAVSGSGNDKRFDRIPPLSPFPQCPDPPLEFQSHPWMVNLFIFFSIIRRRFEWVIGERHREIKKNNNNNFRDTFVTKNLRLYHKKNYFIFFMFRFRLF